MCVGDNIQVHFYKFLDRDVSLTEFENWIYDNEAQIELAVPEFHLDLISFDYKQPNAIDLIYTLVYYSIIDQADYAQWQLKRLLTAIISNEKWEAAASTLYREFWDDNARFGFLMQIADYCAVLLFPSERFGISGMVGTKRDKVISRLLYPAIVREAKLILIGIENNKIQITGEKEYVDTRSDGQSSKSFQQILLDVRAMMNDE